jgi:uncharacterized membrane protein (UPF0127 family)
MILNKTFNLVVSKKEKVCSNLYLQALGLMFSRKQNLVMIFKSEKKISLHNFFVFYPIEVIVLNKNKEVIEINQHFRPFTFWNSSGFGMYLIELGLNESKGKIRIGNLLEFFDD